MRRRSCKMAEFDETLELIEKGGATHISAYLLKIEPDSAFGKHPPEGLPTSDEAADFYLYAVEQLEHHRILFCTISPAGVRARVRPSKVACKVSGSMPVKGSSNSRVSLGAHSRQSRRAG